ncbi:glycosyltransferase family 2 protein [Candidatus Bathyarchaeota archaeon]|nr:glycosyltransferase family 2 protein [Candidatus Bathyarchaeota archaeon]
MSRQTFRDFEVVFVDNASADSSVSELRHLLKRKCFQDMKVRVIINHLNLGYCAGNNTGLADARGEYVIFLNNDTFVEPDWLESLIGVLDDHPSVGACQSKILFAQTKKVQTAGMLLDIYGWSLGISNEQDADIMLNRIFYPSGTSVIVRRSILDMCNGFDESLFSGDYDLGWRVRLYGYKVTTSNRSKCYHYGSYATRTTYTHPEQFYQACRERIYVLSKNYSFSRIVPRIPVSIAFMFLASIVWCRRTRKDYLTSLSKAVVWNLKNLKNLATKREKIQRERKVCDNEIEKSLFHYPLMILLAKSLNGRKIK